MQTLWLPRLFSLCAPCRDGLSEVDSARLWFVGRNGLVNQTIGIFVPECWIVLYP